MQMFFDGWSGLLRIVLIAPAAYLALVAMLRITGKRTLTKLNAFDLVITVALGSTLATQILSRDTPLADGVAGMAALVASQWVVTAVSVRSDWFRRQVRSEPALVMRDGHFQEQAMRRERLTKNEVWQAIRANGYDAPGKLDVFLQSDGSLAVVGRAPS
jgi:uncharacterized membrane protein YcaP (DUF421 family)